MRSTRRHRALAPSGRALAGLAVALAVVAGAVACSDDDTGNMFDGSTPVNVTVDSIGVAPAPQTTVGNDTTIVGPGGTGSGTTIGGTDTTVPRDAAPGGTVSPGVGANTPGPAGTTPDRGGADAPGGTELRNNPAGGGVPKATTSSGGARNGAAVPLGVADTPAARGAFCNSLVGVDAALASSAPANDASALRALADRVRPLVDTLRQNAPTPVAGAVQTVADALAQVSRSGDAAALSTPPFRLAASVLGTWAHENCGFQKVDVVADDGGFGGLPPRLRSGITSFRLRNAGQQDHVMVVARKKPGVRAAPLDILRSGVDEAMTQVDMVGAVYAAKGEQSEATAVLTPGSYFVFCDVAGPDGRPHYLDGGLATFTVR